MNRTISVIAAALALSSTLGCSTTIRSMTARAWVAPPDGASAGAAPVEKNAPPAEGAPAQPGPDGAAAPAAPAAPPAPAAPAAGEIASHYYVTYWEGHCKPVLGCGAGESHVKRCKVNADNTATCTEEAVATKALNPE